MDSTAFGLGQSCLQVTLQACNLEEAKYLYDQLIPLTPIMVSKYRRLSVLHAQVKKTSNYAFVCIFKVILSFMLNIMLEMSTLRLATPPGQCSF